MDLVARVGDVVDEDLGGPQIVAGRDQSGGPGEPVRAKARVDRKTTRRPLGGDRETGQGEDLPVGWVASVVLQLYRSALPAELEITLLMSTTSNLSTSESGLS